MKLVHCQNYVVIYRQFTVESALNYCPRSLRMKLMLEEKIMLHNRDSNKLLIKRLFVCFGNITYLFIVCVKIMSEFSLKFIFMFFALYISIFGER